MGLPSLVKQPPIKDEQGWYVMTDKRGKEKRGTYYCSLLVCPLALHQQLLLRGCTADIER